MGRKNTFFDDVREYHTAIGVAGFNDCPGCYICAPNHPSPPSIERVELRRNLILEEVSELLVAIYRQDVVAIAKEVADVVVVALGTADEYCIDFNAVWKLVHKSNMRKKDGPRRADGKVLKPEGWEPPNVHAFLFGD